ncbi:MAG: hypothetical protein ACLQD8_01465 [Thermoplasmata archaeon]
MTGVTPQWLRTRRTSAWLTVTSALLTVCVLGSGGATAAPVAATSSSAPTWAYGTLTTADFHGIAGTSGYAYQGSATFGFSTVFNETRNTSEGLITVHVVRTIGALVAIKYCLPDCSRPRAVSNFSYHAWETTNAWANLTTAGTVLEPNGTVPALALLNSSVGISAKLRESGDFSTGSTVLRDRSLEVNVSGRVSVNLTTPLGLVPLTLTPGAEWNSTSAFAASGSATWSSYYTDVGTLVTAPQHVTGGGTVAAEKSGTVTVNGSYRALDDFGFQGATYPAVVLTITGPFSLREGVILVPAAVDLFGSSTHPWSADQDGSAVVTTARLDVHPGKFYRGHLPIVASAFAVESATKNVAVSVAPAAGPVPAVGIAASTNNSTFVQGQPESVAAAQSDQNCLVHGIGCGTSGGPNLPLRLIVLAGVGSVAAAVIALALIARRRPPAPVYPNSALYPPGATSVGAPRPAPPPKPAEDDPLGNLW